MLDYFQNFRKLNHSKIFRYMVCWNYKCLLYTEKLVGESSSTCLEHESFKVKTPTTIQTRVS